MNIKQEKFIENILVTVGQFVFSFFLYVFWFYLYHINTCGISSPNYLEAFVVVYVFGKIIRFVWDSLE